MNRNPGDLIEIGLLRKARLAGTPAPDLLPVQGGTDASVIVGANDPDTGAWKPYGLLDLTPLDEGDGFVLSGEGE